MRGVSKKMFISILTSVIVFVTMVATTFAWVGIFTYAKTDNFNLNLKVSDLDVNYYLTISATGEKKSFSDEANLVDIQRQVLKNLHRWSNDKLDNLSDSAISALYSGNQLTCPSSCKIQDNILNFYSINAKNTGYYQRHTPDNMYLKFDLYLSVDAREGIQPETEINANVFMAQIEESLKGTICTQRLTNQNIFKDMPSIPEEYSALLNLPDAHFFNINSANAVRFALSIYNPIDINESYNDNDVPINTLIYHGGEQLPTIKGDVFDLGGNLPEDYNTALQELLIVRPAYKNSYYPNHNKEYSDDLEYAVQRDNIDLALIEDNSKLWTKPENVDLKPYLGVHNGVQTKMKITVYYWFEGWDSDCIIGINEKPVTMNLNFTAGIEE